jgi:hypothetical protein
MSGGGEEVRHCQIFDVVKRISFVSSIVTGVQDYPDD